jgi:transcriptional regulator with XRE-family HTH domain
MKLGDKLKIVRTKRNLTLFQVRDGTGLSIGLISDIERNRAKPSIDSLDKLARCYEIALSDLLSDVDLGAPNTLDFSDAMPDTLREFVENMKASGETPDQDIIDTMLTISHRRRRPPETWQDWRSIYYSLQAHFQS